METRVLAVRGVRVRELKTRRKKLQKQSRPSRPGELRDNQVWAEVVPGAKFQSRKVAWAGIVEIEERECVEHACSRAVMEYLRADARRKRDGAMVIVRTWTPDLQRYDVCVLCELRLELRFGPIIRGGHDGQVALRGKRAAKAGLIQG